MEVNVLFFGSLKEIIGSDSLTVHDVSDTHSLISRLQEEFSALRKCSFVVAVDKLIIHHNTVLHSSATVSLMPPFSGG